MVERNRIYDTPLRSKVFVRHLDETVDTTPSNIAPWKSGEVEASIAMDTGLDLEVPTAFEVRFAVTNETTSGF